MSPLLQLVTFDRGFRRLFAARDLTQRKVASHLPA